MAAYIICSFTQKGGSGKTTCAMNLAAALANTGHKVRVVDLDSQQTAAVWAGQSDADTPFPASVVNLSKSGNTVVTQLQSLVNDVDYLIIDCPNSNENPLAQKAVAVADIVMCPVRLTAQDSFTVEQTLALISNVRIQRSDLQLLFVPNEIASKHTNHAKLLLERLVEIGKANPYIHVFIDGIEKRTIHGNIPLYGQTVFNANGVTALKAREEFTKLAQQIRRIEKKSKRLA
jgi:chromosome partitioning protein